MRPAVHPIAPIVRRLVAVLVAVASMLLVGLLAPVQGQAHRPSHPDAFPKVIELPNGWQPEGITRGRGTTIFAGSLANGAIWRVDARTGEGELFAEGAPGRVTTGLDYDHRRDVLWAAGGPNQAVYAFDGRSGELLRTYIVPNTGFLNDIVVTRNGAYVTDSNIRQLIVIPFEKGRDLPPANAAERRPITGDFAYGPGFNANGIDALPNGRALIVVQSSTGYLFRVDPETASTTRIPGVEVTFGDGIELRGRTLYVVRNQLNTVEVVRLDRRLTQARSLGSITDSRLDVPTTATIVAGGLYVVNARFGTPPSPDTTYTIVRLPLRPTH